MKRAMLAGACAVLAAAGCATEPAPAVRASAHKMSAGGDGTRGRVVSPRQADHSAAPSPPADPTTTTVAPPAPARTEPAVSMEVPTTEPAPPTTARTTTTVRPTQLAPVVHGDDFWWRLAMCESAGGAGSPNVFQFQGGTAEKVGYYPGASYDEQVAMAKDWAARIHPREGSSAGWPVCWAVAGGN